MSSSNEFALVMEGGNEHPEHSGVRETGQMLSIYMVPTEKASIDKLRSMTFMEWIEFSRTQNLKEAVYCTPDEFGYEENLVKIMTSGNVTGIAIKRSDGEDGDVDWKYFE